MAMIAPMKAVPQNKGTDPNAPDDPAWSARIAVCGLHVVPNRNSVGLTMPKKRSDSNNSDSTMPSVVRIAISEAPTSSTMIQRSTPLRARKSIRTRRMAMNAPASARATAIAPPIAASRAAGLGIHCRQRRGFGVEPGLDRAAGNVARFGQDGIALHVERGEGLPRRGGQHRLVDQPRLDRSPDGEEQHRRKRGPQPDVDCVIDRQAVKPRLAALASLAAAPTPRDRRPSPRRRRSPGRRGAQGSGSWRDRPVRLI